MFLAAATVAKCTQALPTDATEPKLQHFNPATKTELDYGENYDFTCVTGRFLEQDHSGTNATITVSCDTSGTLHLPTPWPDCVEYTECINGPTLGPNMVSNVTVPPYKSNDVAR